MPNEKATKLKETEKRYLDKLSTMTDEERYRLKRELGRPMIPRTRPWMTFLRLSPAGLYAENEQVYFFIACLRAINKDGTVPVSQAVGKATKKGTMFKERLFRLMETKIDSSGQFFHEFVRFFGDDILKTVDVEELFYDLIHWNHASSYIQKRWLFNYYNNTDKKGEDDNEQ